MKAPLETLRDRKTDTAKFRVASRRLCTGLMRELQALLHEREVDPKRVTFVIILRSAIALLDPALRAFPHARVGVLGLKRDERTLIPYSYYENLPLLREQDAIVVLDPMLATGGSAEAALLRLLQRGSNPEKTYFVGVIAATPGLRRLAAHIPRKNIILVAVDKTIDAHGMIVPGLGDFGDRYFGYNDGTLVM